MHCIIVYIWAVQPCLRFRNGVELRWSDRENGRSTSTSWKFLCSGLTPWGGGGSRLNFGPGCAAHGFKMAPLARPIFLKIIPLARLISTSKVPWVAFSGQNLPNFCILLTKIWKKIWVSLQELPKFDISLTKIAKRYTLAQTEWAKIGKKYTLG